MPLIRFVAVALAALAFPAAAHACYMPPTMRLYPDDGAVLLVRATGDTVKAGPGSVPPSPYPGFARGRRQAGFYGQVVEMERAAGPAGAGLPPGRAVLVPWENDAACEPAPWQGSARWMREGSREAVLVRLRAREHWVDGVPTFDVFNTGQLRSGDEGDAANAELLFDFHARMPSTSQVERDPRGAVEPLRAWLAAHPDAARHPVVRGALWGIHYAATGVAVREEPSPLAGTWRFEISRTGGPVHVLYARTSLRPWWALANRDQDAVFPREPAGYYLDVAINRTPDRLPSVDAVPDEESGRPGNAHADVRLPAVTAPDGSRTFEVWIDPANFSGMASDKDPELNEWLLDHMIESMDARTPPHGTAVLSPDGRAEWTQEMRVGGGRVVTLRGERISDVAYTYIAPIRW